MVPMISPITGILETTGTFSTPSPATMLDLPLVPHIISSSTMVMPEAKILMPTPARTCSHLKPTVRVTRTRPMKIPERQAKSRPIQALPVT